MTNIRDTLDNTVLVKILARLITVKNRFVLNFCWLYNYTISLQKLGYLTQASRVTPPWAFTWENSYKTSPHLGGLPAPAERVTRLSRVPHLSCKRDQDKKRLYMNRRVTPLRRATSPTWGTSPPCKQALKCLALCWIHVVRIAAGCRLL